VNKGSLFWRDPFVNERMKVVGEYLGDGFVEHIT